MTIPAKYFIAVFMTLIIPVVSAFSQEVDIGSSGTPGAASGGHFSSREGVDGPGSIDGNRPSGSSVTPGAASGGHFNSREVVDGSGSIDGDRPSGSSVTLGMFKPSAMISIESSKRELKAIYLDGGNNKTFHCGCLFDKQLQVYPMICEHSPKGPRRRKAKRLVEWTHLVPPPVFAGSLKCWNKAMCTRPQGEAEKGLGCCGEISPKFKSMQADMHNLVPSVAGQTDSGKIGAGGEILFGGKREYALCSRENQTASEPRTGVRGDIARAYFYMSMQYRMPIPDDVEDRLRMWHFEDPPDRWEEERNASIEIVQGNRNPFIDKPETVERVRDF